MEDIIALVVKITNLPNEGIVLKLKIFFIALSFLFLAGIAFFIYKSSYFKTRIYPPEGEAYIVGGR